MQLKLSTKIFSWYIMDPLLLRFFFLIFSLPSILFISYLVICWWVKSLTAKANELTLLGPIWWKENWLPTNCLLNSTHMYHGMCVKRIRQLQVLLHFLLLSYCMMFLSVLWIVVLSERHWTGVLVKGQLFLSTYQRRLCSSCGLRIVPLSMITFSIVCNFFTSVLTQSGFQPCRM